MARREIRTDVVIAAPRERIWAVLANLEAYSEWNPFMVRISGRAEPGARIAIELAFPGGRRRVVQERVRVVQPPVELRWGGGPPLPWLADGDHFFRLEALQDGRTRVHHGENFTGLLIRPLRRMLDDVERGFELSNQALERRLAGGA